MSATSVAQPHDPELALTAAELEELDGVLARFPDSCSLEELDGLLCALVIGPDDVPPGEWLPAVLGSETPEWASEAEAQRVLGLLMRHWNAVAQSFREDWSGVTASEGAEAMYFPLLDEPEESGHPLAEGWACGFRAGLEWLEEMHWDALEQDEECVAVLNLVGALDSGEKSSGAALSAEERDQVLSPLAAGLQYVYAFWRRWSRVMNAPRVPARADAVPGRNDPCSCGSGKKFKKCCGAPERLH